MPNWCNNRLLIDGPFDEIQNFLLRFSTDNRRYQFKNHNEKFTFNKFIQYPERFLKQDVKIIKYRKKMNDYFKTKGMNEYELRRKDIRKYNRFLEKYGKKPESGYSQGGYEWCINNWGTKWDACNCYDRMVNPNQVVIGFETAWSPPLPVIKIMITSFPILHFTLYFDEFMMRYKGVLKGANGEVYEYKIDDIEYEDEVQ